MADANKPAVRTTAVQTEKPAEKDSEVRTAETDDHMVVEPTDEDYDRARTEGAGNEPELPAGVVRREG